MRFPPTLTDAHQSKTCRRLCKIHAFCSISPAPLYCSKLNGGDKALFHYELFAHLELLHCTLNTNRFLYDLQKRHGHVYCFTHLFVASERGEDQKLGLKHSVLEHHALLSNKVGRCSMSLQHMLKKHKSFSVLTSLQKHRWWRFVGWNTSNTSAQTSI